MRDRGPSRRERLRPTAPLLLLFVLAGLTPGCGSEGRDDRAMIDPAKAAAEQKAAEDAQRQAYTKDKLKAAKNARP